jgi:S-adenosyl-L-methionine hydrolase (adenosine-forming)
MAIITLLTDFGLRDHFVGSMKGVILSLTPDVNLVDISHLIPPQDVFTGAFTLGQAWQSFPSGTIHLAVVDPGVGTARKAIAASAGGHFFVAPDNGILTYVMEEEGFAAFEITADHYFRKPVSNTFHGRDVFAPIAAGIGKGIPLHQLGPELRQPVKLNIPAPKKIKENLIQGVILSVDQFGNLITNLKPTDILPASKIVLSGQREIPNFCNTYNEGAPGEAFMLTGSTGYIELAVKNGSAASLLSLKAGAPIALILQENRGRTSV